MHSSRPCGHLCQLGLSVRAGEQYGSAGILQGTGIDADMPKWISCLGSVTRVNVLKSAYVVFLTTMHLLLPLQPHPGYLQHCLTLSLHSQGLFVWYRLFGNMMFSSIEAAASSTSVVPRLSASNPYCLLKKLAYAHQQFSKLQMSIHHYAVCFKLL